MEKFSFRRLALCCVLIFGISEYGICQSFSNSSDSETYLMIRADDIGMSHSVNMALKELLDNGFPVSAGVMFASPWWKEGVAVLKKYDNVSVGVHLTLTSEWENYRWGPIIGTEGAPTLIDGEGYFHHTTEPLKADPPSPEEMEKELRAQIERALSTGLRIDYLDNHMGIARIPGFREVTRKLAEEYNIARWGQFDTPRWAPHYSAHPKDKTDSLVTMVPQLEPGYNYLMVHIGLDDAELGAMKDMNATGSLSVEMSAHRHGELKALMSGKFRKALEKKGVKLITYKHLMDEKGFKGSAGIKQ